MKFPKVLTGIFLFAIALGIEAGLLRLSLWQNSRYHQRQSEQSTFQSRPQTTLSGTWLVSQTFALTNQPNPMNPEAETGWRILTPLQTTSGIMVIDRGYTQPRFTSSGPDFSTLTPTSTTITGILQPYPIRKGWLRGPDTTTHSHLLAYLNPALIVSDTTPHYLIARTATSPHINAVPPPLPSADRHLSYSLQWLGLALAFPVLCFVGWLKNRRRNP